MNFGQRSLSHPLLVEAIEDLFHPVLTYNNKESDAATMKRFGEPTWNNPVVRYLDGEAADVIPREDGVWSIGGTAARAIRALDAAGREVPDWLRLVAAESRTDLSTATFAMHCFWEGEARLGGLDGVSTTRVGWLDGLEVVDVTFDAEVIPFERLKERAAELQCATRVWAPDEERGAIGDAKLSDEKHSLRRAALRHLPLTPSQATKVNAALRLGTDVDRWLSPRQRRLRTRVGATLAARPEALRELTPPTQVNELADYAERLETALTD